jgi:hypothetical protein
MPNVCSKVDSDAPAEYVSADGMMQGTFTGVRWQYEGILIEHDPEMRTITPEDMSRSPKKRNLAGSSQDTVALDLLLADKTGLINCSLRDEAAHRVFFFYVAQYFNNRKLLFD